MSQLQAEFPTSTSPSRRRTGNAWWSLRRVVGYVLWSVGSLIAISAFFAPWYGLTSSISGFEGRIYDVSPWTFVSQYGLNYPLAMIVVVVPFALFLLGSAAFALKHTIRYLLWSVVLGLICLTLTLSATSILPIALGFNPPYYDVSVVRYGGWLEAVGMIMALSGLLLRI